jgi:lysophospholipase L1-like esterase
MNRLNIKNFLPALLVIAVLITAFALKSKPTVYIIGDSTVRNTGKGQAGWGTYLINYLDSNRINVSNQAAAGRSTRTFIKEGRWEKILSTLKKGDYVLMQFGHNEGSKPDTSKNGYRGVLRGVSDSTVTLTWKDGTKETVHTYGAYLRRFIREAKAKGATPVVLSMIPRNQWDDKGKVKRASADFGKWAKEAAGMEKAFFVDLNKITADKYDAMGPDKVKNLFQGDHTHTNEAGASINAASVAEGIKQQKKLKLRKYIL